jgi:hypothetical protein
MTNSALDDDMLCLQNVLRPMRAVRKMLRTDGHAHLRTVDQKSLAVEQMIGSYIARYDAAAMEGIAGRRRFKGAKRRNDRAVAERHVAASNARRASSRAVERGPEAWAADRAAGDRGMTRFDEQCLRVDGITVSHRRACVILEEKVEGQVGGGSAFWSALRAEERWTEYESLLPLAFALGRHALGVARRPSSAANTILATAADPARAAPSRGRPRGNGPPLTRMLAAPPPCGARPPEGACNPRLLATETSPITIVGNLVYERPNIPRKVSATALTTAIRRSFSLFRPSRTSMSTSYRVTRGGNTTLVCHRGCRCPYCECEHVSCVACFLDSSERAGFFLFFVRTALGSRLGDPARRTTIARIAAERTPVGAEPQPPAERAT